MDTMDLQQHQQGRLKTREAEVAARREEQLRNYRHSDMYLQTVREHIATTISFAWNSMFHAACTALDQEEVMRLLDAGAGADADVNCLNVDGLSALHQAAIDNKLEMVKFLINLGADVNVEDREGWTPLHATVNCGHEEVAEYLIQHGADLAAVNSDGNLPIDIPENDRMRSLIQKAVTDQGIDCDLARKREERIMTADALRWAIEAHSFRQPHPEAGKVDLETGTSALHVAAAKGYMQTIRLLIKCCKVDMNVQDIDGWTPLHAATYWGQKDAVETLIVSGANTSLFNNKGETFADLAIDEMNDYIRKIEREQKSRKHMRRMSRSPYDFEYAKSRDKEISPKKGKSCGVTCEVARIDEEIAMLDKAKSWAEDAMTDLNPEAGMGDPDTGRTPLHKAAAKGFMNLMEVLVTQCYVDLDAEDNEGWTPLHLAAFHGQKDAAAFLITWGATPTIRNKKGHTYIDVATEVMGQHISWLIKAKGRNRLATLPNEVNVANKRRELKNKITALIMASSKTDKNNSDYSSADSDNNSEISNKTKPIVQNKLTEYSPVEVQNQEIPKKSEEIAVDRLAESEPPTEPAAKLPENSSDEEPRKSLSDNVEKNNATATGNGSAATPPVPKLSPGNIFKNFFKSFVPPIRDEESVAQRKLHAKRAREARRSTQGISLEEIQNAEMLIRKNTPNTNANDAAQSNSSEKPTENTPNANNKVASSEQTPKTAGTVEEINVAVTLPLNSNSAPSTDHNNISTTATIATSGSERRPSWRLRLDPGCKFALEDVTKDESKSGKTSNALPNSNVNEVSDTVTLPLRRPVSNNEKISDRLKQAQNAKYGDIGSSKNNIRRRSTGISQTNLEQNDDSKKILNNDDSPIDYKKLYERSQLEVERLNKIIKSYEEQAGNGLLEKPSFMSSSLDVTNEKEKREKRALQRKLSEMEEELRTQKFLQSENQRLINENAALVRVISKLSK